MKRWWTKTTVEECTVLSVQALARAKVLVPNARIYGALTKANSGFRIDIECELGADYGALRLRYSLNDARQIIGGDSIAYSITITSTPLAWGKRRWWFICPLTVRGRACNRRAGKLYLPPGSRYFGCRHCHALTYRSCQESDRRLADRKRAG